MKDKLIAFVRLLASDWKKSLLLVLVLLALSFLVSQLICIHRLVTTDAYMKATALAHSLKHISANRHS